MTNYLRILTILYISIMFQNIWSIDQELPFVIIIPSYNNERWCLENLDSCCTQEYDNFRIIYINDCSTDKTGQLVHDYIVKHHLEDRVTLINNTQRRGALENLYNAIHQCEDWEIIATVDGDDFLPNPDVLSFLNKEYRANNIWMTYGQFVEFPSGNIGFCEDFPEEVVKNNSFRRHGGVPVSHVRTFYAWLFKKIKKEDLMHEGSFYTMTWDKAMMIPMLEMCGKGRYKFIPEILYIYNFANPLNDCRVNGPLQAYLARVIFSKPAYQPLHEDELPMRPSQEVRA
jgi:glycosyltransferase involved in cell wall biosynthesis